MQKHIPIFVGKWFPKIPQRAATCAVFAEEERAYVSPTSRKKNWRLARALSIIYANRCRRSEFLPISSALIKTHLFLCSC
jgi:hypothetical protein